MKFKFVSNNLEYANEMISNWKYEGEYHIYDYKNEAEDLLNEEAWGLGKFVALDEQDNLVGELTIEFFKEEDEESADDGYVEYSIVKNNPCEVYEMWMGWGLRPDLCGKGLGSKFVSACIDFAVKEYNYKGEYVRCGVASFNKRAFKTYQKVGFETFRVCEGEIADNKLEIFQMKKKLK